MEFVYEVKASGDFNEVVDKVKESIAKNNFGVLWEMNIKDKLGEKGVNFERNFAIMEVCNPKKAKEVLENNIMVGYFLPCKIVVYEKDESIYIGMLKPTNLMEMVGEDSLRNIAVEVESTLKKAIDDVK